MSDSTIYRTCLAIVLAGTSLMVFTVSADYVRSKQTTQLPTFEQTTPEVPGWPALHQYLPIG